MKKKYAALCCYFGQWPNYFQFWLTSCSYNQGIDFFLVTDIEVKGYKIPDNVIVVNKTFLRCKQLIINKIQPILNRGGNILTFLWKDHTSYVTLKLPMVIFLMTCLKDMTIGDIMI